MKYTRLISRLDIKGPNLVKGVHLEGLRVLGKPEILQNTTIKMALMNLCIRTLLLVFIKEIVY
jgi:hypothetical protein